MEKICTSCKELKPASAYTIRKSGRIGSLLSECNKCRVEKRKQKRKENPAYFAAIERKSKFKCNYGISIDDYMRMLHKQDYKCAICKSDGPGARAKYFAVDHCHATGKVRGLLCTKCNTGLGLFSDNSEHLQMAIKYLTGG